MTHTILEVNEIETVKGLAIVAKDLGIQKISKFKKEDLRAEIVEQIRESLKSLPVDGPTLVAEAIQAIEMKLPAGFFETAEDKSSKTVPHLLRYLGKPLAKGTIVLHADFGPAGTKKARVLIMEKCFRQNNASHHIFASDKPQDAADFLMLLSENRHMAPKEPEETSEKDTEPEAPKATVAEDIVVSNENDSDEKGAETESTSASE